jgi:hypothetical protein
MRNLSNSGCQGLVSCQGRHRDLRLEFGTVLFALCSHVSRSFPSVGLSLSDCPKKRDRRSLGRIHPDWSAELFFDKTEWTGAYILNKKKPPAKPPSVREVVRLIAQLGGFLARKGDGEPGVKSLWLGFQALRHFVSGVEIARKHGYAI